MNNTRKPLATLMMAALLSAGLVTSGCSTLRGGSDTAQSESLSKARKAKRKNAAPNMGVNSYLWRASLETLDFMPLDSVDPFGGVIITDWYANPSVANERFKANVYILDANLRADALKVSVFKQKRQGGGWVDAATDADTAREIENAILTRARELYIATVDAG